jgi:hypothetical protein
LSRLAPEHIAKAKSIVRAECPEMTGAEPTVSEKASQPKGVQAGAIFVLTFQKSIPLPDGGHLARTVRVTMSQEGKVLKLSSSK